MGTQARLAAISLFTMLASLPALNGQQPDYELTFQVVSDPEQGPIHDATIRMTGGAQGVTQVRVPDATPREIASRGVPTNAMGLVTVRLRAGVYRISVSHPAHHGGSLDLVVPPPDAPDQLEHVMVIGLPTHNKVLARVIKVEVRGELPGGGSGALEDALVEIFREGRVIATANRTNWWGTATFGTGRNPAVYSMGDVLRVRVSANGYATEERTIIVGSIQESAPDPTRANLSSKRDTVRFVLRPGTGAPTPPSAVKPIPRGPEPTALTVEVVNAATSYPVWGATVEIERIGGSVVGGGRTDSLGRIAPLTLARGDSAARHATFRAKVSMSGFASKWDDIPDDLIATGGSRVYSIQLQPTTTASAPAASGYPGIARFANWARGRPPERKGGRTGGSQVFVGDIIASVDWRDGKGGPNEPPGYDGEAGIKYLEHAPGRQPPGREALASFGGDPVMVGGYPGVFDRRARRVAWMQGWYMVWVLYDSSWPAKPTAEEALRLANEIAGAIGDSGR